MKSGDDDYNTEGSTTTGTTPTTTTPPTSDGGDGSGATNNTKMRVVKLREWMSRCCLSCHWCIRLSHTHTHKLSDRDVRKGAVCKLHLVLASLLKFYNTKYTILCALTTVQSHNDNLRRKVLVVGWLVDTYIQQYMAWHAFYSLSFLPT